MGRYPRGVSSLPNAAKALAAFMISDTVQKLFPGEGIYAARGGGVEEKR